MKKKKMLVADLLCGAGGSSTGCQRAAWAAGIIEGEGTIQSYIRKRKGAKGDALIAVRVRVVMSDLDIIERLRNVFNVGRVLPYRSTQGLGSKQLFRWDASSRSDVTKVCDAIYPWMGKRRQAQIDKLRKLIQENPPISNEERVRRAWVSRRANAEFLEAAE